MKTDKPISNGREETSTDWLRLMIEMESEDDVDPSYVLEVAAHESKGTPRHHTPKGPCIAEAFDEDDEDCLDQTYSLYRRFQAASRPEHSDESAALAPMRLAVRQAD